MNHLSFKEVVLMEFASAFGILEIEWRRKIPYSLLECSLKKKPGIFVCSYTVSS